MLAEIKTKYIYESLHIHEYVEARVILKRN